MFGSIGSADQMALFLVLHQIQDGGQPPPWKIFNGRISAEVYAIHFML